MGSAITYYRRYTLQSLLSLQAVDDDGQAASQPAPKETLTDERFENALRLIAEGKYTVEKLKAVYNLTPNQLKQL
jgi:hypothetical protein